MSGDGVPIEELRTLGLHNLAENWTLIIKQANEKRPSYHRFLVDAGAQVNPPFSAQICPPLREHLDFGEELVRGGRSRLQLSG